jgi:hypothetical protein
MIYSWCTFLDCYNAFSPLQAYSWKWGSPGFRKTTLQQTPHAMKFSLVSPSKKNHIANKATQF